MGSEERNLLVFTTWQAWAIARTQENKPIVGSLSVTQAQISATLFRSPELFAQARTPVTRRISGQQVAHPQLTLATKPMAPVMGEILEEQDSLSDDEVIDMLTSLFAEIAKAFGQSATQFTYWGKDGVSRTYHVQITAPESQ